ncbi:hypothetical protein HMSSN036_34930 [Paenibacillus macerans]|nr:hypothetical protein HMSSN036_34930 [Paenibacillus macerans]
MSWFNRLPLSGKINAACYLVAALFAVPALIVFVILGHIWVGLILIIFLAALTYPLSRYLERELTDSFSDISSASAQIAKGDFTARVNESGGMNELSRSFNGMVDKLRKILQETSDITRKVMDSSRSISERNQGLIEVMTQVTQSSNELALGASAISEDVGGMTEAIGEIEEKSAITPIRPGR